MPTSNCFPMPWALSASRTETTPPIRTRFWKELQEAVDSLAQTVLTAEELEYMTRHCRFLPRVYWEWLSSFRFQPEKVSIHLDEDRHLNIEITDYLYKATLYEVPCFPSYPK